MSYFSNALTTLRTKIEYNNFLDDAQDHQTTQTHADFLTEQAEEKAQSVKKHIAKKILDHFNTENKDTINVNLPDLTIWIGNLTVTCRNELQATLEDKDYIVTFNADFSKMTVSSNFTP